MSDQASELYKWTRTLLRPFARLLLKRGMSYGEFAEAAKSAFVDAAAADLALPARKQTTSRISTITGLSRKEVYRLQNQTDAETIDALHKLNRAVRVISGWTTDAKYLNSAQQPRVLPFESDGVVSFSTLVKDYSGDITARTIADELVRIGAIEQTADGNLQLVRQAYIADDGSQAQLKLLAESVAELVGTLEHNLSTTDPTSKRFQRKVYYDNIPVQYVEEIKDALADKSQTCLQELNQLLVNYDRDHNPQLQGDGRRKVGIGIYYFEEESS